MIDDEMPIDEDELAVEREFKNRSVTPPNKPEAVIPPVAVPPVTENKTSSPPPNPPPRPNKPTPISVPQAPRPVNPPVQPPTLPVGSMPDTSRLRSLATANGLSTSMDNIGNNNTMIFDIEVMETGDDGRPLVHIERGVSASSEAELRGLYALSDQKIKIIRAYGNNSQPTQPTVQTSTPATPAKPCPTQSAIPVESHEPPKFFNISGVECKLENGKVYQRQWVRLAGADAESFRLVNDTNNKIVPIDGKHIEQKKWVLIQENSDEGE